MSSLIYLQSLTGVVYHYVNGMFCTDYQWQETRDATAAAKAGQELRVWREAWKNYQLKCRNCPGWLRCIVHKIPKKC